MRRLLPTGTGRGPDRSAPAPAAAVTAGHTFHLPDLGEGLAEAEVLEWRVAVGESVALDQVVVEVETAKSVVTLPSPHAGTVTALHCEPGGTVEVGAPLLSVSEEGAPERAAENASHGRSGAVLTGYGTNGSASYPAALTGGATRVPLDTAAADKFLRGHRDTPAVTIWTDADATDLLAARVTLGAGLLPLLARACLAGLAAHPALNARVDTERGELVRLPAVHLGFAAQTPRGVVVPVVRDADRLPLDALAAELRRLTGLARREELPAGLRTGGTFTLNNYGVFDVDGATPILNHPQTAMLGVGRVTDRPWVVEGRVEVRKVVHLSLTFDHRICDGATAAGFLRHVVAGVTAPDGTEPRTPLPGPRTASE
nr:dihydrolipoamide acetyltransferase family protein [Streptomyces griseus]